MKDWVGELQRLRREGSAAVLVTVVSIKGSAPREPGAKMIVTAGDAHGTIGGGHFEHPAVSLRRGLPPPRCGGAAPPLPPGPRPRPRLGGLPDLSFAPLIC